MTQGPRPARAAEERAREEVAWMLAFQKGDESAFDRLLERHQAPVFAFCLRMLRDENAAEDALQEVFLKVIRNVSRYRPRAQVKTYLFTLARNHCVDALRKAQVRQTTSLDHPFKEGGCEDGTIKAQAVDERAVPPDRGAQSAKIRAVLEDVVGRLPAEQREVFLMRQYSDLPFKDIGEIVGAPENTVKTRMRYALERLRAELTRRGVTPETT